MARSGTARRVPCKALILPPMRAVELELVPVFRVNRGMFYARLPLWLPLVLAIAAAAWFERQSRRWPRGVCRRCGYDLSGLDPAARCPECGATDASSGKDGPA